MQCTPAERAQRELEARAESVFQNTPHDPVWPEWHRSKTIRYCNDALSKPLPKSFIALDASKPWIAFWATHSLALLGEWPENAEGVIELIRDCKDSKGGGFGGGRGQRSHLGTTYASLATLATIANEDAASLVDTEAIMGFLESVKQPNGGFRVAEKGEMDVRGVYLALASAKLCGLQLEGRASHLLRNVARYLKGCQTKEGGFAPEEGVEPHGGYTYCAVAAAEMAGCLEDMDVEGIVEWIRRRQGEVEGGMSGRACKQADACYSFWQASALEICLGHMEGEKKEGGIEYRKLRRWIVGACFDLRGGFADKPCDDTLSDFYHTCYALSGLRLCQEKCEAEDGLSDASLVLNVVTSRLCSCSW